MTVTTAQRHLTHFWCVKTCCAVSDVPPSRSKLSTHLPPYGPTSLTALVMSGRPADMCRFGERIGRELTWARQVAVATTYRVQRRCRSGRNKRIYLTVLRARVRLNA